MKKYVTKKEHSIQGEDSKTEKVNKSKTFNKLKRISHLKELKMFSQYMEELEKNPFVVEDFVEKLFWRTNSVNSEEFNPEVRIN